MTINPEIYEQLQKDGIPDDIGVLFIFAVSVVDQKPQHFIRLMNDYPIVYTEMVLKGYFTIDESNDGLGNAVNKYLLFQKVSKDFKEFCEKCIKKLPKFYSRKFRPTEENIRGFNNFITEKGYPDNLVEVVCQYYKENEQMSAQIGKALSEDLYFYDFEEKSQML